MTRPSKKFSSNTHSQLDHALLKFMTRHIGKWINRDRVMYCCGFDSPKAEPIWAYVDFENSRNRVNQTLARNGMEIISRGTSSNTEVFLGSMEGEVNHA